MIDKKKRKEKKRKTLPRTEAAARQARFMADLRAFSFEGA